MSLLLAGTVATFPSVSADSSVVYSSNFASGIAGAEWSAQTIDRTPNGNRAFLGQFGIQTVTLTLTNVPAHSRVTLDMTLFIIRSWDGMGDNCCGPDVMDVRIRNGATFLHTTFANNDCSGAHNRQTYPDEYPGPSHCAATGASEQNTLGYDFRPGSGNPSDSVYVISRTVAHGGSPLVIDFSSVAGPIDDESWGIAHARVSVELDPNDRDADGWAPPADCDDSNSDIHPGAPDRPGDGVDQDCDGIDPILDEDGDGFSPPGDCDDEDPTVHPGAHDVPADGIDQDCDGLDAVIDNDGDGFAPPADCNDADADIHPGAEDVPNDDIDQDCDGADVDDGTCALRPSEPFRACLSRGSTRLSGDVIIADVREGQQQHHVAGYLDTFRFTTQAGNATVSCVTLVTDGVETSPCLVAGGVRIARAALLVGSAGEATVTPTPVHHFAICDARLTVRTVAGFGVEDLAAFTLCAGLPALPEVV